MNILEVTDLSINFGGVKAVQNVSLTVEKESITSIIGPNGAGKTTMFNAINGSFGITSGRIVYEGKDITGLTPHERCQIGIGRTFQITKPFGGMTVLENVAVGAIFGQKNRGNVLSRTLMQKSLSEAEDILEMMNFSKKKDVMAATLNVPERKRLEICRALATKPQLLLLDEVIAGLNPSEVGGMVELVKHVNELGVTILMIEHVMKAVMRLSHRLYVLSFGKLIAEGTPQEIVENPTVIEAYLGKLGQKEAAHVKG